MAERALCHDAPMGSSHQDVLRVSTSDNVGIGYAIAGLGSRITAQLIDSLIIGVVVVVVSVAVLSAINPTNSADSVLAGLAVGGVTLFVYVGYFMICEVASGGRSPGKSAMHLRVISVDGSSPTLAQLLLRNVARILDVLLFGVGALVMFFNSRSRRLGDLLAGTLVVHVRPPPGLETVVTLAPVMLRTPDAGPLIDGVERLGERELAAIRTFLTRPGLEPPLRARLARDMSARLVDRMQLAANAPERQWPPELFLERLYLQLQGRVGR